MESEGQRKTHTHTQSKSGSKEWKHSNTDHDFVLPGEIGRLTQQLALRHGDRAGSLAYQYSVVKLRPSRCWGNQVSTL